MAINMVDGAKLYQQWQDNGQRDLENKRNAERDAYDRELQARQRLVWGEQDQQRADLKSAKSDVQSSLDSPYDGNAVMGDMGLSAPQSDYAKRQGFEPVQYGQPDTQYTPAPMTGYAAEQKKLLNARLKTSTTADQVANVGQANLDLRVGADAARISSHIMQADDSEISKLAKQITGDKRNKYEIDYDPTTKATRVKLGDAQVDLSRAELAQFLAAKHRLKSGDQSALKDIGAIDDKLAAAVKASLDTAAKVADSGNKATDLENKGELIASKIENASMRSALASNKASTPKVLSQSTVAELNAIGQKIDEADPKDRPALISAYNRRYALAATEMGKVIPPKTEQRQEMKVNSDGSVIRGGELFVPDQSKPGAFIKATMPGESAFDLALNNYVAGKKPAATPQTSMQEVASNKPKAAQTQQKADELQPKTQDEFRATQKALSLGLYPAGRGNSAFGNGELLFQDKSGKTVWASQLGN